MRGRRLLTGLVISSSLVALAITPPRVRAAPPVPPPPPAIAPTPSRPGPAPELRELAPLEGAWRCEGTSPAGPFGPEQSYKATLRVKKDLGDFWYALEYEQKKTKQYKEPMSARGFLGYDTAAKAFVRIATDSLGGWASASSKGWQDGKLVFSGELAAMGQRIPFRQTYTKKGDREIVALGELKIGKDWIALGTDTCRR
jgi:hypothetical protein